MKKMKNLIASVALDCTHSHDHSQLKKASKLMAALAAYN